MKLYIKPNSNDIVSQHEHISLQKKISDMQDINEVSIKKISNKKDSLRSLLYKILKSEVFIFFNSIIVSLFFIFFLVMWATSYKENKINIIENNYNSILISEIISNNNLIQTAANLYLMPHTNTKNHIIISNDSTLIVKPYNNAIVITKQKNQDGTAVTNLKINVIDPISISLIKEQIKFLKFDNNKYQILENKYNEKNKIFSFSFKENKIASK